MLARRVIACLDVQDGRVVKGVHFGDLRQAGDPAVLAQRYAADGIDELVILDITATLEDRPTLLGTIRAVSRQLFVPLTVGGGIRTADDARAVMDAGADKVGINSAALADPGLITTLARLYGSQAVVVAIDAKRVRQPESRKADAEVNFRVFSRSGTTAASRDAVSWAREAESSGAGEILLTSIDRDGTKSGFDCALTAAVSTSVRIPVIASGGAGSPEDFAEVFSAGHADAALAASIFHFSRCTVNSLKTFLADRGIAMRLDPPASAQC